MFTLEDITPARNSADATARYWLMRASTGLSSKQLAFEGGLVDGVPDDRLVPPSLGFAVLINKAWDIHAERKKGWKEAGLAAARLSVAQTLYVDLTSELLRNPEGVVATGGTQYRTDHHPIERLAEVLDGKDTGVIDSLPRKTDTAVFSKFAYAKAEGEPYTVLHGDIAVVQAHLLEARGTLTEVVPLASVQL